MLLEFIIKNFRSFKSTQLFSLEAGKGKELLETNTVKTPENGHCLRTAAIYGANAAGKSNLLQGLQFMRLFVVRSHSDHLGTLLKQAVRPFLLDNSSRKEAIKFEVSFLADDIRHQYGFAILEETVIEEYLYTYPHGKPRRLYQRNQQDFQFGETFKGEKKVIANSTRKNALFLTTAYQLNNASVSSTFDFFEKQLVVLDATDPFFAKKFDFLNDPAQKQMVLQLFNSSDISISDIRVETEPVDLDKRTDIPEHVLAFMKENDFNKKNKIILTHKVDGCTMELDLEQESEGTKRLFYLIGPLLKIFEQGKTLVIDELNNSLHPSILEHLVRLFHSPKLNTGNAQLIFTTHDLILLKPENFRRDQVWFVEKNAQQATEIFALSEFKPRKGESYRKGYLEGRYGAIPFINDEVYHGL